ncbi:hypothetical protein RGQ29_011995 [Quercus rubra]|nr:hypothetical protein RGQ29_011995 [Quercus rubra]
MQYFYYFKKQKQKHLTKRCRTTILKGFSYYNSKVSSINPQILNLISSKLIKFVCDCDIKKEKKGEMEAIDSVFDPLREFAKDSVRLVKRCHKPDRKEFTKVAFRTAIGFVVMGFVGFFVKLIFIPINNIIVGSS